MRTLCRHPTTPWLPRWASLHWLLWSAVLAALVLAGGGSAAVAASAAAVNGAATVTLSSARAVADGGDHFPDTRPAVLRPLPDDWSRWRGDADSPVWYRVSFEAAAPTDDLLAVYIQRVCSSFELQLNGQPIYRAGPLRDVASHLCDHPQLVVLPAALLKAGANVIDLRVAGQALSQVASRSHGGGLSALEIGPLSALAPRHAETTALQVGLPQAISATLILMGGNMFLLGWRHRKESHLAYFGALSIGWALVEAQRWLTDLPFTGAVAEFLLCFVLALVTLAAVQFLLRYARWRSAAIGRALALQCALMPASLVLAGPARLHLVSGIWVWVFALEIVAAAAFHLRLRRRQQGVPWPSVALLGAVLAALALELLAREFDLPPLLMHGARLMVPLALVIVGLRLVQRHGQALQASEASRVNLEARIRDATVEIERNFKQLTEMRIEQVTERERKRIAADLHDDLGAKLLTIVHTSDDPRISTLAREALEEMRLSVRGLTGKPVRLADALGDWRAELMSRLTQSGIEGEWSSPDDLPQTLSARAYVQTTRILRESTSNIIKHSGASRCVIEVTITDGDLQLLIQDNGDGIPMELDGRLDRGHGMASMKHRAKQMQGQCLVESGPGYGTVIRLTLPLDHATRQAP